MLTVARHLALVAAIAALTACAVPKVPMQSSPPLAPDSGNYQPEYPTMAKRAGQQGRVILRVRIEPDGTPSRVAVHQSSGFPMLDDAAVDAAKQWRYLRQTRNFVPAAREYDIPITFALN